MFQDSLAHLFEHNIWANEQIIQACASLTDQQLDAQPVSATKGTIRETLAHLVTSQRGYLALLTLPPEARPTTPIPFSDLRESARFTGEALLALLKDASPEAPTRLRTRDDFFVDPWLVVLQVINHATEHREQIKSMLTALGLPSPEVDGWAYGEATGALVPVSG